MAYLTKSRFKLALSCPTKLYYGAKENNYENTQADDPFMSALAEGGYQVGELAKFLISNNPKREDITINTLEYEEALLKTSEKRAIQGRVAIAEAAFNFENLFVRTDLFLEENDTIKIMEVKAKGWDDFTEFLKTFKRGPKTGKTEIDPKWKEYMYDIAFQKYVVQKANEGKTVLAYIVLADKTKAASIDGLNQKFKINRRDGKIEIDVNENLTKEDLGEIPLKIINVDDICNWIFSNKVEIDLNNPDGTDWTFENLVNFLSEKFSRNERIWSNKLGAKCKKCQFKNIEFPNGEKKSGLHECWKKLALLSDDDFIKPLTLELWGGKAGSRSIVGDAISNNKFFLHQLNETDFPRSANREEPIGDAIDPTRRRMLQVEKSKNRDFTPHIDKEGLIELFKSLPAPYHFIDFETTMVALPFHKGRKPYEAIAFQYSYHLMDEFGKIEHKSQYLNFEQGVFPNYEFLRALKNDLSGIKGTIFRYHDHENNYLNHLYNQLFVEYSTSVPDKEELMSFIREIATPNSSTLGEPWTPKNNMQDLWEFVVQYFYSLYAKGSNSIKDILPAIIKSSDYLRQKYSQPIYGTDIMPSLNFPEPHIWIDENYEQNPYKTLPAIFEENFINEIEAEDNLRNLDNGGAAMMAYAYLQFSNISVEKRQAYKNALLRYCELDTMAMVMIWEYWKNLTNS